LISETYEDDGNVLDEAGKMLPSSHEIWIAILQLEEEQGSDGGLDGLMGRAEKIWRNLAEYPLVNGERWTEAAERLRSRRF
jgi:hypothetical protein